MAAKSITSHKEAQKALLILFGGDGENAFNFVSDDVNLERHCLRCWPERRRWFAVDRQNNVTRLQARVECSREGFDIDHQQTSSGAKLRRHGGSQGDGFD